MKLPTSLFRRRLLQGLAITSVIPWAHAKSTTPAASEGPFYPLENMRFADVNNDLVQVEGQAELAKGEPVRITGKVLDEQGNALSDAIVEIWQCDANGRYLHTGDRDSTPRDPNFQGFGRSKTNNEGVYSFRTILPVTYPGRTPHIHVKVFQGGRERLTTQWYLPNHKLNDGDILYRRIPKNQREAVTLYFEGSSEPLATIDLIVTT